MDTLHKRWPTWLVTGTSNGFGLALGILILERNHNLISLSRHDEPNQKILEAAKTSQGSLHHIKHDLSNNDESVLKKTIAEFLTSHEDINVDILVNNAGLAAYSPVETVPTTTLQHLMTVNFYSPLWLIQALLPSMRASRTSGSTLPKVIVNISSTQGLRCSPAEIGYDTSKHALEALSGVLAEEIGVFGIRTMVVNLGSFRTSFATSGERAGFASEAENSKGNPYVDPEHPVSQRIKMVKNLANNPTAARGDVTKGASVLFDGVMSVTGSLADKALSAQRAEGGVERLLIGSDGYVVIEKSVQRLLAQVRGCEDVSRQANAEGVE